MKKLFNKNKNNASLNFVSINIDQETKHRLLSKLSKVFYNPYIQSTQEAFFNESFRIIRKELGEQVYDLILTSKRKGNIGLIMIKNLPIDNDIGDTPNTPIELPQKKSFVSESILAGISQILGEPIGYHSERSGQFIHQICPIKGKINEISSLGSKLFPFHNENLNCFPYTPSYLSLYCLRSDQQKKAITSVLHVKDILNELTENDISILSSKSFKVSGNKSMSVNHARTITLPVFHNLDSQNPTITLELNDMIGINKEATNALDKLKNICDNSESKIDIKLNPGMMIMIDNRITVHSRNTFKLQKGGQNRWLQRLFIKSDDLINWSNVLKDNGRTINDLIIK